MPAEGRRHCKPPTMHNGACSHPKHPANAHSHPQASLHSRPCRASLMPWSFRLQAERRSIQVPSLPAACPTLAAQHGAHKKCCPRWRRPACTPAPATPPPPRRPTLPGTRLRLRPMSRRWASAARTSRRFRQSLLLAQAGTAPRLGPRTMAGRLHTADPAQASLPYPAPDHRLRPGRALAQLPHTRWIEPARRPCRVAARPALQCLALPAQKRA